MGWEQKTITVYTYVSRHNSDDDKRDDSLLDELRDRVQHIAMEHRYESIHPEVM